MNNAIGALLAVAMLAETLANAPAQETYPTRPIRIIVPKAPGGLSDRAACLIGQEFSARLGRQVVLETRPGAGTIIGSDADAKATPDGYTLLLGPSTLAINPASYKKMPYNALTDFAAITQSHFLHTPEIRDRPAADIAEIVGGCPEQIAAFLRVETAKWARAAQAAGIVPQ